MNETSQYLGGHMGAQPAEGDFVELLCALSYGISFSCFGWPVEHGLRTAYLGLCMSDSLSVSHEDREAVFYGALLKNVACAACSAAMALLPDDQIPLGNRFLIDPSRIAGMINWMFRYLKLDTLLPQCIYRMLLFLLQCGTVSREIMRSHCEVDERFARALGFPDYVQNILQPQGEHGVSQIHASRASHILHLSQVMELVHHFVGADATRDIAKKRRGYFDPECTDAFLRLTAQPDFWRRVRSESAQEVLLMKRPSTVADRILRGNQRQIEQICEILADFIDLKSRDESHHSRSVAEVATKIGRVLGMKKDELVKLRCAGLVHGIGKIAIPVSILLKEERLTSGELQILHSYPLYTYQILQRSSALRDLAEVASSVHEWVNGSGYHRQLRGDQIPLYGRVLAVADCYVRLLDTSAEQASQRTALYQMQSRVDIQFDRQVYEALSLLVIAQPESDLRKISLRSRKHDQLTEREIDVLQYLASGLSNLEIAKNLHISRKTVEQHLSNIYMKIGVTCRTAAAVYAIQQGLI